VDGRVVSNDVVRNASAVGRVARKEVRRATSCHDAMYLGNSTKISELLISSIFRTDCNITFLINVQKGCQCSHKLSDKWYSNHITGLDRPWGIREFEATKFQNNHHMKVVRLWAPHTGRLYPPGNTPGTYFCQRLSRPQGHSETGRIMSMKNAIENHQESNPRPSDL
jgi:hypothetical protein